MAALNIEQARAQFQVQRAAQFPPVNLNACETRQRPSLQAPASLRATASASASAPGRSTSSAASRSLKEAALAQYLATEEARDAVQVSLVAAVANGWLALLADDELLALTRRTLETREESLPAHPAALRQRRRLGDRFPAG